MSLDKEIRIRLLNKIFKTGIKGKRESQIVYEEKRYYNLEKELVVQILGQLVDSGIVIRKVSGKKRYKTISEKEAKQIVRYYYVV